MSQKVDMSLGSEQQLSDVFCTQEVPVFPTPNFADMKAYTCSIGHQRHIQLRSNIEGFSNELSRHSLKDPMQKKNLLVIRLCPENPQKRIIRTYKSDGNDVSSQMVSIGNVLFPMTPASEDVDKQKYPFVLSKKRGAVINIPQAVNNCVVLVVSGSGVSHYQTRIGEIVSDMIHINNAAVTVYTQNDMPHVNGSPDVLRDVFFRRRQMSSHWNTAYHMNVEIKWKVTMLQNYKVPSPISEKYFQLTPDMKKIFLHMVSKKMQKDGSLYLMCKGFILANSNKMPAHGPFPIPYEASQVLDISAFEQWEIDGCAGHVIEMGE
jgi:hypothetical protein